MNIITILFVEVLYFRFQKYFKKLRVENKAVVEGHSKVFRKEALARPIIFSAAYRFSQADTCLTTCLHRQVFFP